MDTRVTLILLCLEWSCIINTDTHPPNGMQPKTEIFFHLKPNSFINFWGSGILIFRYVVLSNPIPMHTFALEVRYATAPKDEIAYIAYRLNRFSMLPTWMVISHFWVTFSLCFKTSLVGETYFHMQNGFARRHRGERQLWPIGCLTRRGSFFHLTPTPSVNFSLAPSLLS